MVVKRYQFREDDRIPGGWVYLVIKHSWMAGNWIWKSTYIDFILKDFHFCMLRLLQENTALRSTAATLQERCGRQEFIPVPGLWENPPTKSIQDRDAKKWSTWHKKRKIFTWCLAHCKCVFVEFFFSKDVFRSFLEMNPHASSCNIPVRLHQLPSMESHN